MKRTPRSQALRYELDPRLEPILRVAADESFEVETHDASSGRIRSAATLPTPENRPELLRSPPLVNPVAGPILVEGAMPGDLLAVTIEDIDVPADGFTWIRPGVGPLGDSRRWLGDTGPYTHHLRHEPGPGGSRRDGRVWFDERISWPAQPFIGTMAVAPEREVPSSGFGQGPFGGNLDVREYAPGNTVLLNVYHPGGLLFVGDVHACQADTEFTGTADEIASTVRLSCRVVRGKRLPAPRIVKGETTVFLGIDKPLETAVTRALLHLMEWLVDEHGVAPRDAYLLTSVHPALRVHVYQMIPGFPLSHVAGVEFPTRGP